MNLDALLNSHKNLRELHRKQEQLLDEMILAIFVEKIVRPEFPEDAPFDPYDVRVSLWWHNNGATILAVHESIGVPMQTRMMRYLEHRGFTTEPRFRAWRRRRRDEAKATEPTP